MDNKIKPEYQAWVKHLRSTMPGLDTKVGRFYDEDEIHTIDIFSGQNKDGLIAATIGVMERNISQKPGVTIFTEILMDCRGHNEHIPDILSTIGFYIVKDGWKPAPGVVFEQMISMYDPRLHVKHVMFVPPFQWDDGMTRVNLGAKTIFPLLAVPITDSENTYAQAHGQEALEDLWAQTDCDIFNWKRKGSV